MSHSIGKAQVDNQNNAVILVSVDAWRATFRMFMWLSSQSEQDLFQKMYTNIHRTIIPQTIVWEGQHISLLEFSQCFTLPRDTCLHFCHDLWNPNKGKQGIRQASRWSHELYSLATDRTGAMRTWKVAGCSKTYFPHCIRLNFEVLIKFFQLHNKVLVLGFLLLWGFVVSLLLFCVAVL